MREGLIERLFRPEIQAMSAYHVADAGSMIKLDAMENPYTWPEELMAEWLSELKHCPINRYPDPTARALTQVLRQHDAIPDDFGILLGNGSDEIIQLLLTALPMGSTVMSVAPSFVMYKQISAALGLSYVSVSLSAENFALDLPAMLAVIEQQQPSALFLAYPNNPTGNLFDSDALDAIINASQGLVVIDEAYAPFADASFLARLDRYDNVVIMRTLSKLGLAGLRLGYLIAVPKLIEYWDRIRLPYNINSLTQVSARLALSHKAIFQAQTQQICAQRTWLYQQLSAINGITPYSSAANFILFKTQPGQADSIFSALKAQGVLIKNLNSQQGLLTDCLRVTVGTEVENQAFLKALVKSVA